MPYDALDHRRAFMLYVDGATITDISEAMGVSRVSLHKWKKKGLPEELTGGMDWDAYIEKRTDDERRKMVVARSNELAESSLDFLSQAKDDVRLLFEKARELLIDGQGEKVRFGDVEKLLNLFIRLDNQGSDRVLWMQDFVRKVVKVLTNRITDERILLQIRNDLVEIASTETRRLGPLPGQAALPSPVEIVDGSEADPNDALTEIEVTGPLAPASPTTLADTKGDAEK